MTNIQDRSLQNLFMFLDALSQPHVCLHAKRSGAASDTPRLNYTSMN